MSRFEGILKAKFNKLMSKIEDPIEVIEFNIEQMKETKIDITSSIAKTQKEISTLLDRSTLAKQKSLDLIKKAETDVVQRKTILELAYWKDKEAELLGKQVSKLEKSRNEQIELRTALEKKIDELVIKKDILKTQIDIAKTSNEAEKYTVSYANDSVEIEKLLLRASIKANVDDDDLVIDSSDMDVWMKANGM